MKQKKLLKYIVVAILLGILTGWICHHFFNEGEQLKQIASYFSIISDIFLRLIKMIIAPLVFATIVAGIVSMGKSTSIGSITLKSMTWFITASFVSLAIGMGLANFFQPGAALDLALPTAQQLSGASPSDHWLYTTIILKPCFPTQYCRSNGQQ